MRNHAHPAVLFLVLTLVVLTADSSPGVVPGLLGATDDEETRREWVHRSAGDALEDALAWLEGHQQPEGFWTRDGNEKPTPSADTDADAPASSAVPLDDDVVGRTSLAVLAFVMTGHTHRNGIRKEWRILLRKSLDWLAAQQYGKKTEYAGYFCDPTKPNAIAQHALATQALAQLLRFSGDRFKLSGRLRLATQAILELQSESGGWPSSVTQPPSSADPRTTSLVLAALVPVRECCDQRLIKVPVEELDAAATAAAPYLRGLVEAEETSAEELAGLGTGLVFVKHDRPVLDAWAARIAGTAPKRPIAGLPQGTSLAEVSLNTQSLRRCAWDTYQVWSLETWEALLRSQVKAEEHKGSWNSGGDVGSFAGRAGATAAAAITLPQPWQNR